MTGIYIHVPFCEKRCIYCNFYSTTRGKADREAYVQALIHEMELRRTTDRISSIYLGGGTPSQLDAEELAQVFEALHRLFAIDPNAEITFEANPDDIHPDKVQQLAALGVNRVSLGVQSFDDTRLQFLNRRHSAQQAHETVLQLAAAGIDNLSLDLIYGLPGQQLSDWEQEVETALALPVCHLSAYALTYEPATPLHRAWQRGEVQACDEELSLAMFQSLLRLTEAEGFEHYEISNFARPGRRSRHNSAYWQGVPYLGFGPGAHSFDGARRRRQNLPQLRAYQQTDFGHADVPHTIEALSDAEHYDEVMMTRLRTAEGIDLACLSQDCGPDYSDYLLRTATPFLQSGMLEICRGHLRFTRQGIFISDHIMAELIWA